MKNNQIAWKLTLLITSLIVALFTSELFLRFFFPQPIYGFTKGLFVRDRDSDVIYRMAAGVHMSHAQPDYSYTIETNSLGFRGPEPAAQPLFRIVIIGDSVAFGLGVPEDHSFIAILRSYLASVRPKTDIINTSAPGYSLTNESAMLQEVLPRFHPNVVLYVFCWNDYGEKKSLEVRHGYLVLSRKLKFGFLREYLNNHSQLFALIKRIYYSRFLPEQALWKNIPTGDGKWTADMIIAMGQTAAAQGTRFISIIQPFDGAIAPEVERQKGDFISALKHGGIEVIDLQPYFSGLSLEQIRQMKFKQDPHWNISGNKFVADLLIQILFKSKLISGR